MGLFEQWPYTNLHTLNLDWILQALKELEHTINQFVAINALKYANPIQWDITSQYEKNTIVIDPQSGTAYISVQPVPIGVSLTNTDYWSVVFDLEQFVTKANGNFTLRVEEQTTLTATFPTPINGWIVWGGILYKALTNITAGDQYVVGSNISRLTVEMVTGYIEELTTTNKSNLVAAINELKSSIDDIGTNLSNTVGDLADLNTTDKSNIVAAINEVLQSLTNTVGDLADLNTTDKSDIVAAINEVLQSLTNTVGDLADLNTTDKSNIVAAINEVLQSLIDTVGDLDDLNTPDKSNIVAAINSKESFKVATNPQYVIYVDGINGSDDNDGLSFSTPVKTLDKAISFFNSYSSALRIEILSSGTYTITATVFSGVFFHIKPHVQGIVIQSDPSQDITFYNSDVLFLDDVNNLGTWITWQGHRILTVNSHFELYNVDFQIGFHLEGTNGQFTRCTFERNCLFTDSYGLIVNCTNNTDSSSNYTITFQHNSRAEFRGNMTYGPNYNQQYYQFFINDSIVTNLTDFSTDTATHTFRLERATLYSAYDIMPKYIKVGASDVITNDTNNPTVVSPLPAGVSDLTLQVLQIGNGHYSIQGRFVLASDISSNTQIATLPIPPAQNTWIVLINQNGTGYFYIDTSGRVYIAKCVAGTTYFNGVIKALLNSLN